MISRLSAEEQSPNFKVDSGDGPWTTTYILGKRGSSGSNIRLVLTIEKYVMEKRMKRGRKHDYSKAGTSTSSEPPSFGGSKRSLNHESWLYGFHSVLAFTTSPTQFGY